MILLNLIAAPVLHFTQDGENEKGNHSGKCVDPVAWDAISPWLKFINVLGWVGCHCLLVYEYRKGLSETWSALKLFWTMNMVFLFVDTIWGATLKDVNVGILVIYVL